MFVIASFRVPNRKVHLSCGVESPNCLLRVVHRILFCSCGRKIRVYSTLTGDLLRELQGHEGKVTDFKINPKNHLQVRNNSELDFGGMKNLQLCCN